MKAPGGAAFQLIIEESRRLSNQEASEKRKKKTEKQDNMGPHKRHCRMLRHHPHVRFS